MASGKIHTDIALGFVAAGVISLGGPARCQWYVRAREQGRLRGGRAHLVRDGDVMTVRFTP